MTPIQNSSDPFEELTETQLAELVESNDVLDQENARIINEEIEEQERKKVENKFYRRMSKSPIEIINRLLFFLFLGSFLFSFGSVYAVSRLWCAFYLISAFSCIMYTPNRKAIKELLDGWPNIRDLIRSRIK